MSSILFLLYMIIKIENHQISWREKLQKNTKGKLRLAVVAEWSNMPCFKFK